MFRYTLRQVLVTSTTARPGFRPLQFTRCFSSKSTPITRETLISPDHVRIATAKPTMFEKSAEGVEEVPIPASIRETGIIPDGYSVDFVLDPSRVVEMLAQQNITTLEEMPASGLEELRAVINSPNNLNIIPTSIYELKQAISAQTDSEFEKE